MLDLGKISWGVQMTDLARRFAFVQTQEDGSQNLVLADEVQSRGSPSQSLSGPRVINTLVPDDDLTETYTGLTTSPSNRYLAASSNLLETIEVGSSHLFNNTIYSMLDGSRLCTVSQRDFSALNRWITHSAAYEDVLAPAGEPGNWIRTRSARGHVLSGGSIPALRSIRLRSSVRFGCKTKRSSGLQAQHFQPFGWPRLDGCGHVRPRVWRRGQNQAPQRGYVFGNRPAHRRIRSKFAQRRRARALSSIATPNWKSAYTRQVVILRRISTRSFLFWRTSWQATRPWRESRHRDAAPRQGDCVFAHVFVVCRTTTI